MAAVKTVLVSMLCTVLLFSSFMITIFPAYGAASIELEEFRWNRFPFSVYVDLNQWSTPGYAVAVREALDSWLKAIWNYSDTYDGQSLPTIGYTYYVKNANFTSNPDVIVSFTPGEMGSNIVGITIYRYVSHEPTTPITINITTYSATASNLFVRNVAMHEFGHALGVGHASSPNTQNGPELMYYAASKTEIVFPSTLDAYAFTQLYRGSFSQTIQLPAGIPYVMLSEGSLPPDHLPLLEKCVKYLPFIAAALVVLFLCVIIAAYATRKRTEELSPPPTPPAPPLPPDTHASGNE